MGFYGDGRALRQRGRLGPGRASVRVTAGTVHWAPTYKTVPSVKWEIKCLTGRLFAKKFDVGSAGKTKKWAPQRRL